jgi:hypothetical protein
MATFAFYHDASLTNPIEAGDTLYRLITQDGSYPVSDAVVYFGSPATAGTQQARVFADPGVTHLIVTIGDTTPAAGAEPEDITLALTSGGLDTATPGAALDLGVHTVLSGAANAIPIHIRFGTPTLQGLHTDLAPGTQQIREDAV